MKKADEVGFFSNKSIDELWFEWEKEKSFHTRNLIFEYYFDWCRKITSSLYLKYGKNSMEWHDCLSITSMATLKAIENFDKNNGAPFEGYAYLRLKGSVINEASNSAKFLEKNTSHSSDSNIEDKLEFRNDSFKNIVDFVIESALAKLLEAGVISAGQPDHFYEKEQTANLLANLVNELKEQQKFVIKSHYFQQLSFKEISLIMKISSARVSQIHKAAIFSLRELYEHKY